MYVLTCNGFCVLERLTQPMYSPTLSLRPLFAALILFLEWLTFFLGTALRNPSHCNGSSDDSVSSNSDEIEDVAGASVASASDAEEGGVGGCKKDGRVGRVKSSLSWRDAMLITTEVEAWRAEIRTALLPTARLLLAMALLPAPCVEVAAIRSCLKADVDAVDHGAVIVFFFFWPIYKAGTFDR